MATKKATAKKTAAKKNGKVNGTRPRNFNPTIQNVNGDKFYTADRTFEACEAVAATDDVTDKEFLLGVRRLEGRVFDADYKASIQFRRAACGHHVFSKCKKEDVQAYGDLLVSIFA